MNPTATQIPASPESELLRAFEECTLAEDTFDHAAHVRVAWALLREHGLAAAAPRFIEGLKRFAAHHGAAGLYHETITWAYLVLVNERLEGAERSRTWQDFAARNPDLLARGKALLARYYPPEVLGSELARRVFLLPVRGAEGGDGAG